MLPPCSRQLAPLACNLLGVCEMVGASEEVTDMRVTNGASCSVLLSYGKTTKAYGNQHLLF